MQPWIAENVYSVRRFMLYPASGIFAYGVIRLANRKDILLHLTRPIGLSLFTYYAIQSIEVITTGVFTYNYFGEERISGYNISWGYGMLTAIIFLSIDYIKSKKKIWNIPFIVVGFVGILLFGSRVPCVIYIAFVLMIIFLYGNYDAKNRKYRNSIMAILILLFFLLWIFYLGGLTWIIEQLKNFGIESRTLLSLLEGTLSDDNGRSIIWETVLELIKQHPFIGNGVFGERNAVYAVGMRWGYSHNIFLEILVDFGCIFGGAMIIYGLAALAKVLLKPKDKDFQLLFISFFVISVELLVSNSFWFHMGFWALLALGVNYRRQTKKSNKQRKMT